MKVTLVRACILLFAAVGTACSYTDRMPELPDQVMAQPEQDAIASWLLQQLRPWQSFKNLYHVKQDNPRTAYRYAVVYKAPSSFRMEMFPDSGFYSLGLFVQRRGRAVFIDQAKKHAIVDHDGSALFKEVFGLPLPVQDLPFVLSGQVPARLLSDKRYRWYRLANERIAIVHPEFSEYWEVFSKTGQLKRVQLRDPQRERLLVELTVKGVLQDEVMPSTLAVEVPLADTVLTLTLDTYKADVPVASELFSPAVPSNFSIDTRN